jgi:hypothetical protein
MLRSGIREGNSYTERLGKLLPAEAVAIYMALYGILNAATGLTGSEKITLGWIVFGVSLVVTIVYLALQKPKPADPKMKWWEILLATISFVIWALSVGGVLRETFGDGWRPLHEISEKLIVAAWTIIPPMFIKKG